VNKKVVGGIPEEVVAGMRVRRMHGAPDEYLRAGTGGHSITEYIKVVYGKPIGPGRRRDHTMASGGAGRRNVWPRITRLVSQRQNRDSAESRDKSWDAAV